MWRRAGRSAHWWRDLPLPWLRYSAGPRWRFPVRSKREVSRTKKRRSLASAICAGAPPMAWAALEGCRRVRRGRGCRRCGQRGVDVAGAARASCSATRALARSATGGRSRHCDREGLADQLRPDHHAARERGKTTRGCVGPLVVRSWVIGAMPYRSSPRRHMSPGTQCFPQPDCTAARSCGRRLRARS